MTKKNNAMKPFDDKFAENVREVFDTFQEPADMEAWEALRQKLTNKRKTRILGLPPWSAWAAAAAVMLLISGLLWFYPSGKDTHTEGLALTSEEIPGKHDIQSIYETESQIEIKTPETFIVEPGSSETKIPHTPERKEDVSLLIITEANMTTPPFPAPETKDIKELTPEAEMAEIQVFERSPDPEEPSLVVKPSEKQPAPAQNLFFENDYAIEPVSRARSSLQVTAGSMFAFTNNQVADGVGFAAGVLNEWNVTDGFSIATGGVLTFNQFSFDPYASRNLDFAASPTFEHHLSGKWEGKMQYDFQNHYQIMAIDIPVNARFRISHPSQRNQLYLSAGFSSLLYLQEQFTENSMAYTESYFQDAATGDFRSINYTTRVTENETVDAFQRFDFARLLNISFGYAIKRDKGAILIEPFLKYPLGGITSRDIQLGMGGISLKYSFTNR
jgi:hypothetical protein